MHTAVHPYEYLAHAPLGGGGIIGSPPTGFSQWLNNNSRYRREAFSGLSSTNLICFIKVLRNISRLFFGEAGHCDIMPRYVFFLGGEGRGGTRNDKKKLQAPRIYSFEVKHKRKAPKDVQISVLKTLMTGFESYFPI